MVNFLRTIALMSAAATEVLSHPAAEEHAAALAKHFPRGVKQCRSAKGAEALEKRNVERRQVTLNKISKRSKIVQRDWTGVLNISHHSNLTGVTPSTDASVLFSKDESCVLVPETTQGPYYVVGELFRSNITEDQTGIPLYMDVQFVNADTCEPIENMAIDIWHCNATGVYAGISQPQAGLDTTWLRGIQATDADGVVQFQSIFPGHYTSRATHVHVLAHSPGNWTKLPNNTITGGGYTSHIGQFFYDQDLISQVEATSPYTDNQQELTLNADDDIIEQEAEKEGVDPMANYVLLGDSIEDGIFSWVSIAVNVSAVYDVDYAVERVEGGGIEYPCFEMINLPPGSPPVPSVSGCPVQSTTSAAAASSSTSAA